MLVTSFDVIRFLRSLAPNITNVETPHTGPTRAGLPLGLAKTGRWGTTLSSWMSRGQFTCPNMTRETFSHVGTWTHLTKERFNH